MTRPLVYNRLEFTSRHVNTQKSSWPLPLETITHWCSSKTHYLVVLCTFLVNWTTGMDSSFRLLFPFQPRLVGVQRTTWFHTFTLDVVTGVGVCAKAMASCMFGANTRTTKCTMAHMPRHLALVLPQLRYFHHFTLHMQFVVERFVRSLPIYHKNTMHHVNKIVNSSIKLMT